MRKVTKEVLKSCADNLLFELDEDNLNRLLEDFDALLQQINYLQAIENVDDMTPMAFPYEYHQTYLRPDVPGAATKADKVLKIAKNKFADQIKVSKVIGE